MLKMGKSAWVSAAMIAVIVITASLGFLIPNTLVMGGNVGFLHMLCNSAFGQANQNLNGPSANCTEANTWYTLSVLLRWIAAMEVVASVAIFFVYRASRGSMFPNRAPRA